MVWCKAYFDIFSHLGVTHDGQTDRRTDGRTNVLLANDELHNVARQKNANFSQFILISEMTNYMSSGRQMPRTPLATRTHGGMQKTETKLPNPVGLSEHKISYPFTACINIHI